MGEDLNFRKLLDKVFWAGFKALLIVTAFSALEFGFDLSNTNIAKGTVDAFWGSLLLHLLGLIIFIPVIFVYSLVVVTPVMRHVIKRGKDNLYMFVAVNIALSSMFFGFLPAVIKSSTSSHGAVFTDHISLFGIFIYAMGGGLSGWFLYKSLNVKSIGSD